MRRTASHRPSPRLTAGPSLEDNDARRAPSGEHRGDGNLVGLNDTGAGPGTGKTSDAGPESPPFRRDSEG